MLGCLLLRWCSGRRVGTGVRFPPSPQHGAAGVPGAGGPGCGAGLLCGARPLCVPVGGGPPARSPHASCARSGRSRGPPWPCRHPPAPRPGPAIARGCRSQALRSLRRPPHQWGVVADVWLGASSRSPARPRHSPQASQISRVKPTSPLLAQGEPQMKPTSPLRLRNGCFGCVFRLQW